MIFEWDENKRLSNLEKHKLDFKEAGSVYFSPFKVVLKMERNKEVRNQDIALVEIQNEVLSLVYVLRGEKIRIISFRRASKNERNIYAERFSN